MSVMQSDHQSDNFRGIAPVILLGVCASFWFICDVCMCVHLTGTLRCVYVCSSDRYTEVCVCVHLTGTLKCGHVRVHLTGTLRCVYVCTPDRYTEVCVRVHLIGTLRCVCVYI